MAAIQTITRASLAVMSMGLIVGCAAILDGPFNKNGVMVPELLYDNNGSGYVTYWDDETNSYRTHDERNDVLLETAIFTLEEAQRIGDGRTRGNRGSRNYVFAGSAIKPLTHLDAEGMKVQKQQGCTACHEA